VRDETDSQGLRDRLTRQGEDALGKLAQDLLENPLINGAITSALGARDKATQAQEVALGALNIPSAADIERLTRRVRSVSQRLEGIEDGVDRLDQHVQDVSASHMLGERLERIEQQLTALAAEVAEMGGRLPVGAEPVARGQERLRVGDAGG
jgi:chromosome segregation ATPase